MSLKSILVVYLVQYTVPRLPAHTQLHCFHVQTITYCAAAITCFWLTVLTAVMDASINWNIVNCHSLGQIPMFQVNATHRKPSLMPQSSLTPKARTSGVLSWDRTPSNISFLHPTQHCGWGSAFCLCRPGTPETVWDRAPELYYLLITRKPSHRLLELAESQGDVMAHFAHVLVSSFSVKRPRHKYEDYKQ